MKQESEILSLTGFRFIAALYVFLFHMHTRWPITSIPFLKNVLDQGAVGMSIFFTLSGFLLALRYVEGGSTVKDYLVNRFARIYPIYVLAAFSTLPWIGINFQNGVDYLEVGKAVFLVLSNIFLVQAWFPQLFAYWNDSGSWSISVEAFCYLVLPIVLPLMAKFTLRQLGVTALALWLLALMPGVSAYLFGPPAFPVFYAIPVFRLPEFLLGVCAFLAVRKGVLFGFGAGVALASSFLLICYLGLYGAVMPIYIGNNWIVIPVICILIVGLSTNSGPLAWLFSRKIFVWLGKISYSFYSMQALLIFTLNSYHEQIILAWPVLVNGRYLAVTALFVLIILSAVAYYIIEEPSRRWIKSVYIKSTSKVSTNPAASNIK